MLRETGGSSSQQLLVTLLGDNRQIAPDWIPTAAFIRIMREFEIGEESVRTALNRLAKQGLLQRQKNGRETAYSLTDYSNELLDEGEKRLNEFALHRVWNGKWTAIAFTIHEKERSKRHKLRAQLRALGFGPLYDGFWISPSATLESAKQAAREAEVTNAVVMRSEIQTMDGGFDRLCNAWNTAELREAYIAFLAKYKPLQKRLHGGLVPPSEALVVRTRLMDEWRVFPQLDPEIPEEFLPGDWPRSAAGQLFRECYTAAAPMAEIQFKMLLEKE